MIITATPNIIKDIVEHLLDGKLAALPTETVYGLAADATNGEAVAEIFAAKGRPHFNPLIAHVASKEMAARYVAIDKTSDKLMEEFWPGPLTLVLPLLQNNNIHPLATAGLATLGLRNPKGIFSEIVQELGRPLVAPSANRSGGISPTSAIAVQKDFKDRIPLIVDAGACEVGLESTILKVDGNNVYLLRPGGLEREAIEAIIKKPLQRLDHDTAIEAPGMLKSHYAPNTSMRLNVNEVMDGEAFLHFGNTPVKGQLKAKAILNLSAKGNLKEAAVNLFEYMQRLDLVDAISIAVAPIPLSGLGEAINDRLTRAAAPK